MIARIPGIYSITNTKTKEVYVGRASNLHTRKQDHFRQLASGKHVNWRMQNSYKLHGKNAFVWDVLEECPVEDWDYIGILKWLTETETRYIKKIRPAFNLAAPQRFVEGGTASPVAPEEFDAEKYERTKEDPPLRTHGLLFSVASTEQSELVSDVRDAIRKLDPWERYAIEEYWGISGEPKTMTNIAAEFGVSLDRVSKTIKRGYGWLRIALSSAE